jgi:hypothetical protein
VARSRNQCCSGNTTVQTVLLFPHYLPIFLSLYYFRISVLCVLFVCKCVMYCCHRVSSQMRVNIHICQTARFSKKKLRNIELCFDFLYKIFLNRLFEEDFKEIIINLHILQVKYLLLLLYYNKILIFLIDFRKIIKY